MLPESTVRMMTLMWLIESVVECSDKEQEPAQRGGNLVHEQIARRVLISAGKDVEAMIAAGWGCCWLRHGYLSVDPGRRL